MDRANTPQVGARYWVALCVASVFGANCGDFASHVLGLGHVRGLPVLALLFAAVLLGERRATALRDRPADASPVGLDRDDAVSARDSRAGAALESGSPVDAGRTGGGAGRGKAGATRPGTGRRSSSCAPPPPTWRTWQRTTCGSATCG